MKRAPVLLTCREADRLYRLRHGTSAAAFRAGRLPGKVRGRAILVSAKRADELFGLGLSIGSAP